MYDQPPVVKAVVSRFARLNPAIDVDDLRQEAWVTILTVKARGTWRDGGAPLECYLASAVEFRLAAMVRKHRLCECDPLDDIEGELLGDQRFWCMEERLDQARAADAIARAIETADDGARAVLLEGIKPAEAAASLGLLPSAVYDQTERVRRTLRKDRVLQALAA